jgi:hypothetical protein
VLLPIKSPNLAQKKYNKKKDLLLSTRVPYYRELKILATPADDKLVIFGVANIQQPNNNNNTVHWGEESKSKKNNQNVKRVSVSSECSFIFWVVVHTHTFFLPFRRRWTLSLNFLKRN